MRWPRAHVQLVPILNLNVPILSLCACSVPNVPNVPNVSILGDDRILRGARMTRKFVKRSKFFFLEARSYRLAAQNRRHPCHARAYSM